MGPRHIRPVHSPQASSWAGRGKDVYLCPSWKDVGSGVVGSQFSKPRLMGLFYNSIFIVRTRVSWSTTRGWCLFNLSFWKAKKSFPSPPIFVPSLRAQRKKRPRGNKRWKHQDFPKSSLRYALIQLRFERSNEYFYTLSMRFNALERL